MRPINTEESPSNISHPLRRVNMFCDVNVSTSCHPYRRTWKLVQPWTYLPLIIEIFSSFLFDECPSISILLTKWMSWTRKARYSHSPFTSHFRPCRIFGIGNTSVRFITQHRYLVHFDAIAIVPLRSFDSPPPLWSNHERRGAQLAMSIRALKCAGKLLPFRAEVLTRNG